MEAANPRNRLLTSNKQLESTGQRVRHALEVAADAEATALEITEELNRNREKLEGVSSRVNAVTGLADSARRVVAGMGKREVQQKVAMWVVGLCVAAGVTTVIYYS